MTLNIDLEQFLKAAMQAGALSGNTPGYGPQNPFLLGKKEAALTLSTSPSLYGTSGLFGVCGSNDLLSLVVEDEPFLDWLGWKANNEVDQFVKMLTYVGPAGTAAGSEGTGAAAACDDPAGVEYGAVSVLLPDKGRIKRAGPVRDLTENNRKLCDASPLFTKDGVQISDELMWSFGMAGMTLKQDLKRMVVVGNASTANEFSGLQTLVNTGYRDSRSGALAKSMDSTVIAWTNHAMSWQKNGTHVFVDYLIDVIRRIRQRAQVRGGIGAGDQVIVLPTFLRDQLLDSFTFWSIQPGVAYNEVNFNSLEARTFRNGLNGGAFGMGQIFVDSMPVPIVTYDWSAIGQAAPYFTGDVYVLTRRIGSMPVMWGQFIDMTQPAARFQEEAGYGHYKAIDGGKFLAYWKTDNECTQAVLVMRPNVYLSAPWAQARFTNVAALRPLNPLSDDPTNTYYAETNLVAATTPEDYLLTSPA